MKTKVQTVIYLIKDTFGNKYCTSCEYETDEVYVSQLSNKDGEMLFFESEAYHLQKFCDDNDLELKTIINHYDFDTLWNDKKNVKTVDDLK